MVLDKFTDFIGLPHKTRQCPLPSDAVDRTQRADEQMYLDNFPYKSLLGALLYLSMNTRPDIAYAVGLLSQFGAKPTRSTCKLLIYLQQYVRGTVAKASDSVGVPLIYLYMHVFKDANWAGDILTPRSSTEYIVLRREDI